MAHPKRKQSKTRTAKRRTHDKAVASVVITEENWQSKKKLRFKLLSISMYGPKAI